MKSVTFSILSLLLLQATSCIHYIDKVRRGEKKVQIMQGNMTFYPDSNILIYKSDVGLKMDNEILKPKSFYVKLPKGLKGYEIVNSESFVFYYSHQQIVAINIKLSNKTPISDTIYEPTKIESDRFLNSNILSKEKLEAHKIKFNTQRDQRLIKKGAATILLYNITADNFNEFSKYLEGIRFL